jgi:hypothetical protein
MKIFWKNLIESNPNTYNKLPENSAAIATINPDGSVESGVQITDESTSESDSVAFSTKVEMLL